MNTKYQESETVELKERFSGLEKDIVAFANANGGTIYIGVSDNGNIKPLELTNKLRSEIVNCIVNCEPRPIFTIEQQSDGVIACKIESGSNKPYKAPNGFYLRIGATSQKLSRDEIIKFYIDENRISYDLQIQHWVNKADVNDYLDQDKIDWFRQTAGLIEMIDNTRLLTNLGLIHVKVSETASEGSLYGLTNAVLLVFGKNTALHFPNARVIIWKMASTDKVSEQKIFTGNIVEQLQGALNYLVEQLNKQENIKGITRKSSTEIPDEILRELVLNALIHRDYFEKGAEVQIKILPEYIEFSNPGRILYNFTPEEIIGKSLRRNPLLAEVMQRLGYIERAGTGLIKVKNYLTRQGQPLVIKQEGAFFIALVFRRTVDVGLSDNQSRLLSIIREYSEGIRSKELAAQLLQPERTVRHELSKLVQLSLVQKQKIGRSIFYYPADRH